MPRSSFANCLLLIALVCPVAPAQEILLYHSPANALNSEDSSLPLGVEILSDTNGVDIQPYVKQIMGMIYKNWKALLPAEAKPPQSKQAEAAIRLKLLPDGRIAGMWLDSSTHDDAINQACWRAIASNGQFPPLPAGIASKPLEMRIHFSVNMQPH